MKTLAVKYRPVTWKDVVEQDNIKVILQQQLSSNSVKNAYLFCGPAGDGKTTTARIFANAINKGQGNPIELDAASNNSVDDMRTIIAQAKTKSLDSEYKIFIIDECHMISNAGWNAVLKLIEEPPAKSIFLFATTNPEKIPKTILSRVQRFDFHRISQRGIYDRLMYIAQSEGINISNQAADYIAKISNGGMRDAITAMDKCTSFTDNITLESVVNILGVADYDTMFKLTDRLLDNNVKECLDIINELFNAGKELKQFIRQYIDFVVDIEKYLCGCGWEYLQIPRLSGYEKWLNSCGESEYARCREVLDRLLMLNANIKWSTSPKFDIEAELFLMCDSK